MASKHNGNVHRQKRGSSPADHGGGRIKTAVGAIRTGLGRLTGRPAHGPVQAIAVDALAARNGAVIAKCAALRRRLAMSCPWLWRRTAFAAFAAFAILLGAVVAAVGSARAGSPRNPEQI